ncbi:MAG: CHRD domain-containing protein [wastewater metagenome]|nr:CHRD domain-containing protein [Candidatus Loosdrechtia aerotolerans]
MWKKLSYGLIAAVLVLGITNIIRINPAMAQNGGNRIIPFTALLTGGQEVPENDSKAFGVAFMTFEVETRMLCYSITFTDDKLTGTETVAHFHAPAAPGENADIIFDITPDPSPVGSPKNGCVGPLTRRQGRDLNRGLFYINIHSDAFPGGEIRGQVLRVEEIIYNERDDDNDDND